MNRLVSIDVSPRLVNLVASLKNFIQREKCHFFFTNNFNQNHMTRTFFIRIYNIVATNRIKERIIFYFFYFSYIKISKSSYFQKFTTIHSIVHK